ncbi:hypothetical protein ACFVVC_04380 [Pseudarthrobacter sp. NPDC058196]|uniref:hypothetical protein n=1 Tax=Pseudarthrobacter sp. NPDC058196 TaxID=3346376 RepID=UPI0036D8942A
MRTALEEGLVTSGSPATLGRWLAADAIRPWRRPVEPFTQLVAKVMTTEPYASARRVLGRGQRVLTQRHALHRPDAHRLADRDLVDLPVHASWLNQVENYFSILQRKAITGRDFTDLDQFAQRVLAFQDRDNTTAEPFDWKYTRHDLRDNLQRLSEHKHDLAT